LTENAAKIVQPVGLIPEYLASWFRSAYCQIVIQQNIHSGGQGKLALFRIEQLPVPLAPLAEQKEIVRRVEALVSLADQLEARYAKATAHIEKLTQSILAKAFRGELVPQDPNDEPASVLLKRIQQKQSEIKSSTRKVKHGAPASV
jgi:type I restriction enzyme S subunit